MAEISIAGIIIDTEDIDLLVNYCPLATIEGAVRFDRELLKAMSEDHPERSYWEHRLETHELALSIAERTFEHGVRVARKITAQQYTLTNAIITEAKKSTKQTLKVIDET